MTEIIGRPSVDGSEGGTVIVGQDTGWRDLGSLYVGVAENVLFVRRIGDQVTVSVNPGQISDAAQTLQYEQLPAGFRPMSGVLDGFLAPYAFPLLNDESTLVGAMAVQGDGTLTIASNLDYDVLDSTVACGSVQYPTTQPWPTPLPGSAA